MPNSMNVWQFLDRHASSLGEFLKGTVKDLIRFGVLMLVLYMNADNFDHTEWTAGTAWLAVARALGVSTKEKAS